jgi:FKBP-type peptidyl-prolyl cis-trans isomerase
MKPLEHYLENTWKYLDNKLDQASNKLLEAEDLNKKLADQIQSMQAERIRTKLKDAETVMQANYDVKLEECRAEFSANVAQRDRELSQFKKRIATLEKGREELQVKYGAAKNIIREKMTELKITKEELETVKAMQE